MQGFLVCCLILMIVSERSFVVAAPAPAPEPIPEPCIEDYLQIGKGLRMSYPSEGQGLGIGKPYASEVAGLNGYNNMNVGSLNDQQKETLRLGITDLLGALGLQLPNPAPAPAPAPQQAANPMKDFLNLLLFPFSIFKK